MKKYKFIGKYEDLGIKLPKERGGTFLYGHHYKGVDLIEDALKKYNESYEDDKLKTFTQKISLGKKIILSEKDLLAYRHFINDLSMAEHQMTGFNTTKDFAVDYLNCAKVGSFLNWKYKGIATSDFRPYTNFEKWIRDGFHICPSWKAFDFDPAKKLFIPKTPSLAQRRAEMEKKDRLEQELGRSV